MYARKSLSSISLRTRRELGERHVHVLGHLDFRMPKSLHICQYIDNKVSRYATSHLSQSRGVDNLLSSSSAEVAWSLFHELQLNKLTVKEKQEDTTCTHLRMSCHPEQSLSSGRLLITQVLHRTSPPHTTYHLTFPSIISRFITPHLRERIGHYRQVGARVGATRKAGDSHE